MLEELKPDKSLAKFREQYEIVLHAVRRSHGEILSGNSNFHEAQPVLSKLKANLLVKSNYTMIWTCLVYKARCIFQAGMSIGHLSVQALNSRES